MSLHQSHSSVPSSSSPLVDLQFRKANKEGNSGRSSVGSQKDVQNGNTFTDDPRGFPLLHTCATGYAAVAGVSGGFNRTYYVVTSADDEPTNPLQGTLRWGLAKYSDGVYVTFLKDMQIQLKDRLFARSNTTIDGRGTKIHLKGAGIVVMNVKNVILHNLHVSDQPGDFDVIPIRTSSVVWVDHCRVLNGIRGLISVVYGSTDVTISNCYLKNENFTMLCGAEDTDDRDKSMRVTAYRNWFDECGQRQPHCRWGQCHVANNVYEKWGYYCLGGRVHGKIRSERNYFSAGKQAEVTPWFGPQSPSTAGFDNTSNIFSFDDLFLNGATLHEFSGEKGEVKKAALFVPPYTLEFFPKNQDGMNQVKLNAGPQSVV